MPLRLAAPRCLLLRNLGVNLSAELQILISPAHVVARPSPASMLKLQYQLHRREPDRLKRLRQFNAYASAQRVASLKPADQRPQARRRKIRLRQSFLAPE